MNLRPDNRKPDELRPVSIEAGIAPHATGSTLISCGDTRVICAAMLEPRVPTWMRRQRVEGGWITAEYSLLPYSTITRKDRDSSRGRIDGRSIEIQRLIGRAMRAVTDLMKLPGYTLWIDCDVLQADGGTRTAAITGAYVAARLAVAKLIAEEKLSQNPFLDSVAAVSVGIYRGQAILDLNYLEDRDASVDCNIVMTGSGEFVEIQSAGEEATFSRAQSDQLLDLACLGIARLTEFQCEVIGADTESDP